MALSVTSSTTTQLQGRSASAVDGAVDGQGAAQPGARGSVTDRVSIGASESLASGASVIQDVDVAAGQAQVAQGQILAQAAVAVLAQANQAQGRVLALLQ
jgi:flagellin-like hook-associated protein FlgL